MFVYQVLQQFTKKYFVQYRCRKLYLMFAGMMLNDVRTLSLHQLVAWPQVHCPDPKLSLWLASVVH